MSERSGIVVVDRLWFWRIRPKGRDPVVPLNRREALLAYRGLDGRVWPEPHPDIATENGFAPATAISEVRNYVAVHASEGWDVVFAAPTDLSMQSPSTLGLTFLGIDMGYFESEMAHFSSVLNEIVFGHVPQMTPLATRLNSALLFRSEADAEHALRVRTDLLRTDADLERDDAEVKLFSIYAIML